MRLRAFLITLIICFSIFQSGCWDYEEYEDLVQVSAIGIDYDKNSQEIIFSIQYIPTTKSAKNGGSEGTGSSPQKMDSIHSVKAKTIYEAVQKMQEIIYKKLFYGYLKVLVIGEDAAKYKILDIIELFDRTPVVRSSSFIALSSGKAEDTISTFDNALAVSSSEEIFNLINSANNIGSAYAVSIQEFTTQLAVPGLEATAPRIITVSNIPKVKAQGGSEENIKYDLARPGDRRVAGVGAFKGDVFKGWLNEKESIGFGFIVGKKILPYIVHDNLDNDTKEDTIYYRLSSSKGKVKVKFTNGKPVFTVDVRVTAELRKYYSHQGSYFINPEEVSSLEKKLSDSIRSDISAAIAKGHKELKTDIFGFGFALFREDPQLWRSQYEKKWDKLFPNIPITIKVDAHIRNTGTNIRRLYVR